MDVVKIYQILGIVYPLVLILLSVLMIIWAVKKGQFTSQGRASSLPLEVEEDKDLENR